MSTLFIVIHINHSIVKPLNTQYIFSAILFPCLESHNNNNKTVWIAWFSTIMMRRLSLCPHVWLTMNENEKCVCCAELSLEQIVLNKWMNIRNSFTHWQMTGMMLINVSGIKSNPYTTPANNTVIHIKGMTPSHRSSMKSHVMFILLLNQLKATEIMFFASCSLLSIHRCRKYISSNWFWFVLIGLHSFVRVEFNWIG